MEKLPLETQTLYAELQERLVALEAHRSIGHLSGTFVAKTVKGSEYYYFQYSEPGGVTRQAYLGKRSPILDRIIEQFEEQRPQAQFEIDNIHRLCAQLRAGGAMTTDHSSARVLMALADGGVFRSGGVLVGTHAFVVLGNILGYRWKSAALRTQDIDIASDSVLRIAVPELSSDVPQILESLKMGFLPVPGFDPRSPSTSYKIRGQSLRVDLLGPETRPNQKKPIPIPRWNAAAQPLKYLDYLLEDSGHGSVVDGGGILVNLPSPARFALHKLITAQERAWAFHAKKEKDLQQALQILSVLILERPGDLKAAWGALKKRGPTWEKKARAGLAAGKKFAGPDFNQLTKLLR